MVNFSIIIPHKNIPQLLQKCLDSIPRRDDIQIIVVDDNSDPSKVDFSNFPGIGERCVEVYFTKEGKGAGYARNVGLTKAKGKWLLFADADDFYNTCFIESIDKYKDSDFDIVFFKTNSIDLYTSIPNDRCHYFNQPVDTLLSDKDNVSYWQQIKTRHHVPPAKMIRRDMQVKLGIYYEEVVAANDILFHLKCNFYAKKLDVSDAVIYCITVREDSLFYSKSKEFYVSRFNQAVLANSFLRSVNYPEKFHPYHYLNPIIEELKFTEVLSFMYKVFSKSKQSNIKFRDSIYFLKKYIFRSK